MTDTLSIPVTSPRSRIYQPRTRDEVEASHTSPLLAACEAYGLTEAQTIVMMAREAAELRGTLARAAEMAQPPIIIVVPK